MNENSNQNEIVQNNEVLTMVTNDNVVQNNVVQNNVVQNESIPPKKNNSVKIIVVLVLLILLFVVGIIIGKSFAGKTSDSEKSSSDNESKIVDNNTNEKDDKDEKKYTITLYKSRDGYCLNADSECSDGSIELAVKYKDAKFLSVANLDKSYALYIDNFVYIYDIEDQESTKLKIDVKNYNVYDFVINDNTKTIIGVFCGYKDEDSNEYTKTSFYNINNEKTLYDNKYYNYEVAGNGYLTATLKTGSGDTDDDYTQFLLNQNKEELLISKVGENIKYKLEKFGNDYLIVESDSSSDELKSTVYTKKKDIVFKNVNDNLWSFDEAGNVFVSIDNIVKKYNFSGITLKTSRDLHNVLHVIMNYALVVNDNNELVLINLDSNKEYKLMDYTTDNYYYSSLSGYFDAKELGNGSESGIYIIVGLGDGTIDGDESGKKFFFNPKTNDVQEYDLNRIIKVNENSLD